jgi:hypothetical protein
MLTEKREVSDFNQISLRGYGELFITQGEQESLTVQADEDVLSTIKTDVVNGELRIDIITDWVEKISSFFSKGIYSQRISFDLTVKELTNLDIIGAARVKIKGLQSEEFAVKLGGAADITIDSLKTVRLKAELPGAGMLKIAGKTTDQSVTVSGAGTYEAPHLESQSATIQLTGLGKATVWAVEELEATLIGLGSIEYYGDPIVTKSVQGLGSVTGMGTP